MLRECSPPGVARPERVRRFSRRALRGQPRLLAQTEQHVGVLKCLSRRTFHQIVDRRNDDERGLPDVGGPGYADLHDVATHDIAQRRRLVHDFDEWLAVVAAAPERKWILDVVSYRYRNSGEYSARDRQQVRREQDVVAVSAQLGGYRAHLRQVTMLVPH